MKNDKIVEAFDNINFGEQSKMRVLEKIKQKNPKVGKNIMSKKIIAITSVAALLAICLLGANILGSFNKGAETVANSFSIVVYAADGSEVASLGEDVKLTEVIDPDTLERLKDAQNRIVAFHFIGNTFEEVEIKTSMGNETVSHRKYACSSPEDLSEDFGVSIAVNYPENLTEDFIITTTAHFTYGTSQTKTIIIPAN